VKIERFNFAARALMFLALAAVWLTGLPARAVLSANGTDPNAVLALGNQYASRMVWISASLNGQSYYFQGLAVCPTLVLTAAHQVRNSLYGTATIIAVGTGTNYLTSPGATVFGGILSVVPAYDGTQNTPDIATITLPQPLPVSSLAPIGSGGSLFATASSGQILTGVGSGLWGTPSSGYQSQDGNFRGFNAPVLFGNGPGYSDQYYLELGFNPGYGVTLNGKGAPGDSGGGIFNSLGQPVGIMIGQFGGSSGDGSTEVLVLSSLNGDNWFQSQIQNAITPVVPQLLSLTREGVDVRLVWQGKGGSNYVVQAAASLSGTNAFTDVSASITLPGVGPVTTNFLDAGTLTNCPARFYRIRTN
jgi:Trypsin